MAQDNFPSRRPEATIALAGPLTGALLAAGNGLLYFATRNGAFAAAAAWMALINLAMGHQPGAVAAMHALQG